MPVILIAHANNLMSKFMLTDKPLPNRFVANESAVSVVQVTFSQSLIECQQVQVDSIVKVK